MTLAIVLEGLNRPLDFHSSQRRGDEGIKGATLYHSFRDYLDFGDTEALLYSTEDRVGFLRIVSTLSISSKIPFFKSFKAKHL